MSVYKTLQHTEGLEQDLFWITAASRRSAPLNMSNFTTAAFKNYMANKVPHPNIVTEHKIIFSLLRLHIQVFQHFCAIKNEADWVLSQR